MNTARIVNGTDIRDEILEEVLSEVKALNKEVSFGVVLVGDNSVTERFVSAKEHVGKELGIRVVRYEHDDGIDTETLVEEVEKISQEHDGVIVQMPLPKHVDKRAVLDAVPSEKDIDVLSSSRYHIFLDGDEDILPPVVGACKEVLERNNVSVSGKRVLIVGKGMLVGKPAEEWFRRQGAEVSVVAREDFDTEEQTKEKMESEAGNADIVLLGAGSPGLLTSTMVSDGVVILDAGTSEENQKLSGDADMSIKEKASLFTPVPGGIGPITTAILFRNLLRLTKK